MSNHHDKFIKETLTRKKNAVSFFREYLPEKLVSQFDWRTLSIAKETFIDPELRERYSDIIYSIQAKGKPIFIYLLLEHQSTVDPWMPLRFLHYMIELWELYLKQNPEAKKLPGIIPVLFYHGEHKWNVPEHFEDLLIDPDLVFEFVPRFKYLLNDFSPFSDIEIKGEIIIRLFLTVMNKIFSPDFHREFEKAIPLFVELSKKKTGMEYLLTVLRYLFKATDVLSKSDIEDKLIPAIEDDKKGDFMTLAEIYREEGKIEGKIEGEIEGEIKGRMEAYKELMKNGLLSKEIAEKKIDELMKELLEITAKDNKEQIH